ncbi:hypothetical protein [Chryseobacterium sp. YIM B08800]|uniref:hypothetical protein n=1 Tax=Chryseobacterium sp. YIM B08800 TaxID=2984136 RepID=UPI00223F1445|nr:hypothetical protein [Chryseobacterium sp. YIM B08800]
MSLTISFIYLSESFNNSDIQLESDLFGFEICRKELWGNQKLNDLGCLIIPKLKEFDLFIIKDELQMIYEDCQIILENINEISLVTNYSEEFIEFRINNLLKFIKISLKNKENLGLNIS